MPEFPRDVDMQGITKESIMNQLGLTETQINGPAYYSIVIEKLFCCAILNQGTNIAAKILANYNNLRDILYEVKK